MSEPNPPWSQKCVCGRLFRQPNSYSLHIRSCQDFKARLGKRLQHARLKQNPAPDSSENIGITGMAKGLKRSRPWLNNNNLDVDVVAASQPQHGGPIEFGHAAVSSEHDQDAPCLDDVLGAPAQPTPEVLGRGHRHKKPSYRALLNVVGDENFNPKDVREANWPAIDKALATSQYEADDLDPNWEDDDGISWACTDITITVPFNTLSSTPGTKNFVVPGFHYRPLVPTIKRKLESLTTHEFFHTFGYELRWRPSEEHEDVRVYGEIYTSPAFLEAYKELQQSPVEKDCSLPRYVLALMFASDATMLASFGTAKLWPLYLCFGNDSKYRRAKPSENLFEQVAYFEKAGSTFLC
ncbi:hypothetical protein EST38_g6370 [Candolleomyces aberdarensis]|uniref:Uncharacterized protein n=1 Tax=Candolleomyces aberdarensis TaxID=2316362 RepID=A0A4Q2DHY9_9AGAR|nr:hypothetical protein EST38_g6370 [Candolleomyces aberdarensis]